MNQFLQYFGLVCLILIVVFVILRLIFGKKWQRKVAWVILVGPGLLGASKKLADELPNKVKKETLAEVATYAFMRLTRIGLIGLTLAIIPIALLWIQNNKISEQNEKIDDQNFLIESQRRSSLVLLMNNILTDLSKEIEKQREGLDSVALAKQDTIGYALSKPLIGRISSLSQGLLPYRFLVDGELTEKEYSIERGQLLLALVKSGLDSVSLNYIFFSTIFGAAYLRDASLIGADLRGAELYAAALQRADLGEADLGGADLGEADLSGADLSGAVLFEYDLSNGAFYEADLGGAGLYEADLSGADLSGADLRRAVLSGAYLSGAYLSGAVLRRADLSKTQGLFEIEGLDQKLKQQLEKEKPCLFTKEGCE